MKLRKTAAVAVGMFVALGAAAPAMADSGASGSATGSPGVLSGNVIQVPIDIPVNVCGNTVNVLGLLNPAANNSCSNGGAPRGGTAVGTQTAPDDTSGVGLPEEDTSAQDAVADCICHELTGH